MCQEPLKLFFDRFYVDMIQMADDIKEWLEVKSKEK